MAEHDVTEAIREIYFVASLEGVPDGLANRIAAATRVIEAALAARTTPVAGSEPVAWQARTARYSNGNPVSTMDNWFTITRNEFANKLRDDHGEYDYRALYTHPTGAGADAEVS